MQIIGTFFSLSLTTHAASPLPSPAEEPLPRPKYKAVIECYNPNDDFGRGMPMLSFDQTGGHTYRKYGTTFIYPRAEELNWEFLRHEAKADVYEFTRRFSADGAENRAERRIVWFSGERIVVFRGRGQTVAIRSPQFQGPEDASDDTNSTPATIVEGLAPELPRMVGKSPGQLLKDHGAILRALTGAATNDPFATTPLHVWMYPTPRQDTNYVVFSAHSLVMIPGNSSASVVLVSSAGRELGRWAFSTGWRIDFKSADLAYNDIVQAPVMTVGSAPSANGRDVAKQYFAFVDDRLYFVRIEDREGHLIRNDYLSPNFELGCRPPAKSARDWTALLESDQLALRLAALTYLSGVHMDSDNPRMEIFSENIHEAKVAQEFIAAETTRKRIAEYQHSPIPWLAEAAELASTPPEHQ